MQTRNLGSIWYEKRMEKTWSTDDVPIFIESHLSLQRLAAGSNRLAVVVAEHSRATHCVSARGGDGNSIQSPSTTAALSLERMEEQDKVLNGCLGSGSSAGPRRLALRILPRRFPVAIGCSPDASNPCAQDRRRRSTRTQESRAWQRVTSDHGLTTAVFTCRGRGHPGLLLSGPRGDVWTDGTWNEERVSSGCVE